MLTNLRVVVMVVVVSAPKWLMVRKMKFCPTVPHRQNNMMSLAASGLLAQNLMASYPPPPGNRNMKAAMYAVPHRMSRLGADSHARRLWKRMVHEPGGEGILCGVREAVQCKIEQTESITQRISRNRSSLKEE